jgi:C4-dicarboxylate-specific signal transduction histidine kinase
MLPGHPYAPNAHGGRRHAAYALLELAIEHVDVEVHQRRQVIEADVEQLRVVLSNLLLNAAQAMERRGRIVLTARQHDGAHCQISVTDEGQAFPGTYATASSIPFSRRRAAARD